MKKVLLVLSMALLLAGSVVPVSGQEEPKPKKDTVNMDTNAKPEFYYATDDAPAAKKGASATTIIIVAAVAIVVIGGVAFYMVKKKK